MHLSVLILLVICFPICLLQWSASSSGARGCLLYLCFLMSVQGLACNRCSLNVCGGLMFSWGDDSSTHTHLFSWNQIEFLLFYSPVFTELGWAEGILMPTSYDSDSPNSQMFHNSPSAHPPPPAVMRFLHYSTFPRLSCNLEKLGWLCLQD